jgi:hypothetical protein
MECHLGRKLDPDKETVDHLDSNFDNNDLSNLRLVPRNEHSSNDTRRVKPKEFTCAWCDKNFERSPRLIRDKAKKNKAGPFCSRPCAGKYSRMLQLKLIDKFDSQKAVDSEYYKKKYVKASFVPDDFEADINFLDLLAYASSNLKHQLLSLRGEMAAAAQTVLDAWEQDEEGYDEEFGSGGACDAIQRAMSDVLSKLDVSITEGGQPGDDHAYLIVYNDNEAYEVDIPPHVYERGGGYSWKKIPNVQLTPEHVVVQEIDRKLLGDFEEF